MKVRNIWVVWSETSYSGDKMRCYNAGQTTNKWRYSANGCWRQSFAKTSRSSTPRPEQTMQCDALCQEYVWIGCNIYHNICNCIFSILTALIGPIKLPCIHRGHHDHWQYQQIHNHLHQYSQHNHNLQHDDIVIVIIMITMMMMMKISWWWGWRRYFTVSIFSAIAAFTVSIPPGFETFKKQSPFKSWSS